MIALGEDIQHVNELMYFLQKVLQLTQHVNVRKREHYYCHWVVFEAKRCWEIWFVVYNRPLSVTRPRRGPRTVEHRIPATTIIEKFCWDYQQLIL